MLAADERRLSDGAEAFRRRGEQVTAIIAGDAAGFPDWVFARQGRIVIAELKSEKGRLSRAQKAWLSALGAVEIDGCWWPAVTTRLGAGAPDRWVGVLRPSDWPMIERLLARSAVEAA